MPHETGAPETATAPSALRLAVEDRDSIERLRGVLAAAGYNEPGIRHLIQAESMADVSINDVPLMDRVLPRDGLLPALIRLFICRLPVDPADLAPLIKPLTPETLQSLGLIRLGPGRAEPLVRLLPIGGMVLACEPFPEDFSDVPPDFVLGLNPTSVALASLTIRRPFKTALDLGTGFGIQAISASRHCDRIVATDINPRALNYTAFNCLLNGITNVECREGSLFEPVAGDAFDLILCNPPFVVSPDAKYQFRDGGRPLDAFCRSLVQGLPGHLNEGGFGIVLCSWVVKGGEHWSDPVRRWVEGSGCDALIFHTLSESPLAYAALWNRPLLKNHPVEFGASLDRWVDHFKRSGVECIASGGVVLRRPSGRPNWVDAIDVPIQRDPHCGEHIARMFESRDWLAKGVADDELLRSRFALAPDAKLEQAMGVTDGRLVQEGMWASLSRGFKFRGDIDSGVARLLLLMDGSRSLGDIVETARQGLNVPAGEFRNKMLAVVRGFCASGLLIRS